MNDDDLLTPSLDSTVAQPIYSVGALVAAAFFGGCFAVPLLAAENARRMGRLRHDAIWLAFGILISAAALIVAAAYFGDTNSERPDRNYRLASRVLGFVLVGAVWLLHRKAYRASTFMGLDRPSPYAAVIAVVLLGHLMSLGLWFAWREGLFVL